VKVDETGTHNRSVRLWQRGFKTWQSCRPASWYGTYSSRLGLLPCREKMDLSGLPWVITLTQIFLIRYVQVASQECIYDKFQ